MRMCLIAGIIILILVIVVPAGEYPSRLWLQCHLRQKRMKLQCTDTKPPAVVATRH